ncbi:MAG: adaptor protein MecA [Hominisplanchenecus sp.]|nr:adaptor protein MecA [Lachnospiraceae bacterium]MDY2820549.1 adaptor protein MecA [Hominisplanchenecus sp.]
MKIEKINDNQIRCTLTREDLADRKIKLSELAYGTDKAKLLFRDMMQQAAYEFGFEANDIPLMIEAIPISPDSVILIVTKVEDPEELDTRFAKFSPSAGEDSETAAPPAPSRLEGADDILNLFNKIREAHKMAADAAAPASKEEKETQPFNLTRLYRFRDLDTVIRAAHVLQNSYSGYNSLYKNAEGHEYLLTISKSAHTPEEFNKICNMLSEYAVGLKYTPGNEAFFEEHLECIVADEALQKLALI